MLKIGEFSKLSHLTVKALRFYEKEGILLPASTDKWTGYRLYETAQLEAAASIKAYRQLGLSIEEIRAIQAGADVRQLLTEKANALTEEKRVIDSRLSIIHDYFSENRERFISTDGSSYGLVIDLTYPELLKYNYQTYEKNKMNLGLGSEPSYIMFSCEENRGDVYVLPVDNSGSFEVDEGLVRYIRKTERGTILVEYYNANKNRISKTWANSGGRRRFPCRRSLNWQSELWKRMTGTSICF